MKDVLSIVKEKFNSDKLEDNIGGIDIAVSVVSSLSVMALRLLEKNNIEKDLIADRLSLLFQDYLQKLIEMTKNNDPDISFWSSSLIVHYRINHQEATYILTEAVKNGESEKAYMAATILTRVRDSSLIYAINERFKKKKDMDDKERQYFEEKLAIFNS